MAPGKDSFGLDVSTTNDDCIEAINDYYEAVLAYKPFTAWIAASDKALATDPGCPLAKVAAADCAYSRGEGQVAVDLMKSLEGQEHGTWRELQYVAAWTRWVNGDPAGCFEKLQEAVERHPEDLFAVKRGQLMGLLLGEGAKIKSIVEVAGKAVKEGAPPRFLHGMWSFGLEQEGQYEEAEAKAREGLAFEAALGPDPWLDHSMAHALYFQGEDRQDDAVEFLEARAATGSWDVEKLHPFLYTHCWWHLALLYCERRDFALVWKIFDEQLWPTAPERSSDPQVHLNALNLLWRLETRGQSETTRDRWANVLTACRGITLPGADGSKGTLQHCDLLLDILLVRGLCVAAKEDPKPLDAFLEAIRANEAILAASPGGANGRAEAYRDVALLVAELFRGDQPEAGFPARQAKARQELRALEPKWTGLGGSTEQRSVLLEALEGPIVSGAPEKNFDTLFLG